MAGVPNKVSPVKSHNGKKKHRNQTKKNMSKYLFLGVAAILSAAGAAAKAYADGAEAPPGDEAPGGGEGGEPAKRGRGRPPGGTKTEGDTKAGATDAERFDTNRALIKPLIDGNQGEDVKKVIAKYSKTGLKDLPAASQADFEKDIAALSY